MIYIIWLAPAKSYNILHYTPDACYIPTVQVGVDVKQIHMVANMIDRHVSFVVGAPFVFLWFFKQYTKVSFKSLSEPLTSLWLGEC